MLRYTSIVVIVISLGWFILALRKKPTGLSKSWKWLTQQGKNLWMDVTHGKFSEMGKHFKGYVYFLTLLCFIVLAVSGLIPFLVLGEPLSGFLLLVHVAVTPVFAILMVLSAIIWANSQQFTPANWKWAKTSLLKSAKTKKEENGANEFWSKVLFWLAVLFTMLLASIVLSMYPLFGSIGQKFLLDFHKFSSIALTVVVLFHILVLVRTQK